MKTLTWAVVILGVAFVGIQFIRPARTNPTVDETRTLQAVMPVPADVQAILERSCNDCHSYETTWPWYSHVAPVSWYLVDHVKEARDEFSLSDWAGYDVERADHKLEEMCEMVENGEMPLTSYTLLHPSARLSDADVEAICTWTEQARARLQAEVPPVEATH